MKSRWKERRQSPLCFQVNGSWWRVFRWKRNSLPPPRTWFDLPHSDSNFFPTGWRRGGNPRHAGRWQLAASNFRLIKRAGGEGTKGGIQYSRWTWHAWKKFAWKGKKGRKGGKKGSTCPGPPFLFLEGARSLIKLNRNLISMGNVSTNRVGKDLCEWGRTRLHCVARWCTTYGTATNGKGWRGSKGSDNRDWVGWIVLFFWLERRRSWEVSVRNKELCEIIVFCKYYKFKNIF